MGSWALSVNVVAFERRPSRPMASPSRPLLVAGRLPNSAAARLPPRSWALATCPGGSLLASLLAPGRPVQLPARDLSALRRTPGLWLPAAIPGVGPDGRSGSGTPCSPASSGADPAWSSRRHVACWPVVGLLTACRPLECGPWILELNAAVWPAPHYLATPANSRSLHYTLAASAGGDCCTCAPLKAQPLGCCPSAKFKR